MEIGIIGLPQSGKTTVFSALTRSQADSAHYGLPGVRAGAAKVPDERLANLQKVFQPQKVTPAELKYLDFAVPGLGKGEGIGGELLNQLSTVDALMCVTRAFKDERIPHVQGTVNPRRDTETINLELAFSDLVIIERRLNRLGSSMKGAKPPEREMYLRERELLDKIKASLEADTPIWRQSLSAEELKTLANYQFLTAKPALFVLNLGEDQLAEAKALEAEISSLYPRAQFSAFALCAKLEMELSQLSEAEAAEFCKELGVERTAYRIPLEIHRLLRMLTFFTTVSGELRAWAIPRGTPALKAAGKIHSDIERGFIRAEVIGYDDLLRCGSVAEARRQGKLRLEGKTYTVADGDIITFLFNV